MLAVLPVVAFISYHLVSPALAELTVIQHVSIAGIEHIERRDVLSLLDLSSESTLMSLDLTTLEERLESHPWIASASVGRALPNALAVVITERRPAALFKHAGGQFFLDDHGVVVSIASEESAARFPILVGLPAIKLLEGDRATQVRAEMGVALAKHLQARFGHDFSIDLSDPRNMVAAVEQLRLYLNHDFAQGWQQFLDLESTMQESFPPERADIDLRYAGKVIIRQRG